MEKVFERVVILILDGVGVGSLPDAHLFHDEGSNTLLHITEKVGLNLPNMSTMGLSQLIPISGAFIKGAWGKMAEKSMGKDTTTGHWEISGIHLEKAFPTYPDGFPPEIIEPFCQKIDREILGNCAASGTEIIQRLGDEHVATGKPIVYTSADSVFQLAAHEDIIPVPKLYEMCTIARQLLTGKHQVGRVIARPFIGNSGNYTRTTSRHDFSLDPVAPTVLDLLKEKNYDSIGVGKIGDIFAGRGITKSYPVKGNEACFSKTLDVLDQPFSGLLFVNLVDFDMLYGHRNNPQGFKECLETFDAQLPQLVSKLHDKDLLLITADHGNDPTTPSTDHAREYVPLLAYHNQIGQVELGIRSSFSDIAKTIAENFSLTGTLHGTSFLKELTSN